MNGKILLVVWMVLFWSLAGLGGCDNGGVTDTPDDDIKTADQGGDDVTDPQKVCEDKDLDGYFVGDGCRVGTIVDCDDTNAAIYPQAVEVCDNQIDENCDGADKACDDPCVDLDKDGADGKTAECPAGTDCDDADNDVYPGATELCGNKVDEDCDGADLACPAECLDADKDNHMAKTDDCPQGTDCDDADNDIHPDAVEICGNKVDEDCDGKDEDCPPECNDGDGDGYGSGDDCIDWDCNDGNDKVHPGAEEICDNGIDDDCVDGDADCPDTCDDGDEDGFGIGGACVVQDCNDEDKTVFPGAEEICGNDKDEDCDGADQPCVQCVDEDGDGYGEGDACTGPDCDDSNPEVNPASSEVCGNGLDDDCLDGDQECTEPCEDKDNDGYGVGGGCTGPDCNDGDPEINPAAAEICENGKDDDCQGGDAECPAPNCESDYDCDAGMLCDQANGTCRFAKVWEWYAPTFYVDTDTDGEGLDLLRAVNFDGDWNAANNETNLASGSKEAVVYYSFVKTSTHWYLGYYSFFPKRWGNWLLDVLYENTMRSVLIVVEQDGTMYGKPVLMETQTEDTFFQYGPKGSPLSGIASMDGDFNWDLFFPTDHHPLAYVHSKDHGIWGDAYFWNNIGNWDVDGFPGGDGVIYRFGNVAEKPVMDNDEVYYDLIAVHDELWPKRNDIGSAKLFQEFGKFAGGAAKSLAPWRLHDSNLPLEPQGELFWNPADFVRRDFKSGWGGFSFNYLYNPYAVKVTIFDLMVYVTADPLGGPADPFINLYMYDGSGWETLMLSNFNGYQNNWYASDVEAGTLLNMQTELGGRNYFYGFPYPNEPYFGIQVRDKDALLDDWLMDDEKTHWYDFVGKELKSWGKSDSYLQVDLP